MRREWSLVNIHPGDEVSFLKVGMKKSLEPILSGCGKYVLLSKQEKRNLFDWDNMDKVIAMMEACNQ